MLAPGSLRSAPVADPALRLWVMDRRFTQNSRTYDEVEEGALMSGMDGLPPQLLQHRAQGRGGGRAHIGWAAAVCMRIRGHRLGLYTGVKGGDGGGPRGLLRGVRWDGATRPTARRSPAKSSQVKPNQPLVKSSQVESRQVKASQGKSSQPLVITYQPMRTEEGALISGMPPPL